MRKNSVKNTRINTEVKRELAEIIRGEIKDPRIAPLTSVCDVEVAPDLKTAKAYISVLGSEEVKSNTLIGLNSAQGYIKSLLAKRINLRNTPTITFVLDTSVEYGMKIEQLISEVNAKKPSESEESEEDD